MQHTAKYPCDCVTLKLSVSTSEPSSQLVTTHQLLWVAISKELLVSISSTKCVSNSNIWQAWTSLCQVIRMPLGMISRCESGDSQLSCPSFMSQGLQKKKKKVESYSKLLIFYIMTLKYRRSGESNYKSWKLGWQLSEWQGHVCLEFIL